MNRLVRNEYQLGFRLLRVGQHQKFEKDRFEALEFEI
jgi:hypothetical protein